MNNIQLKIGAIYTVFCADSEQVLGLHFIITGMMKLVCFFSGDDKQEKNTFIFSLTRYAILEHFAVKILKFISVF